MKTASHIARYLLGLIFLVLGLNGFLKLFFTLPGPTASRLNSLAQSLFRNFYVVIFLLQNRACPAVAGQPLRSSGAHDTRFRLSFNIVCHSRIHGPCWLAPGRGR